MRRRIVLHWATWAGMAIVGVALLAESAIGQYSAGFIQADFGEYQYGTELSGHWHGWPMVFLWRPRDFIWTTHNSRWPVDGFTRDIFQVRNVGIDVIIAIGLVVCTGVTVESYARREKRWHQFDIPSLLKLTLIVAVLLTLYQAVSDRFGPSGTIRVALHSFPRMWSGDAAWEYFPLALIALSIACAVNVAWLAAAALLRLFFARLRRFHDRTAA